MPTTPASKAKKQPAKSSPASAAPDAVKLLMSDHKEVKGCFEQYKKLMDSDAESTERKALAEKICGLLTVHATIEEEIFYPAARAADVEADLLDEAEVEHASCKDLIAQIQTMDAHDELFDAKVTVLGEYIDHHVKEEEGELFPKCKKAGMDMPELGAELQVHKTELTEQVMRESAAQ